MYTFAVDAATTENFVNCTGINPVFVSAWIKNEPESATSSKEMKQSASAETHAPLHPVTKFSSFAVVVAAIFLVSEAKATAID